MPRAYEEKCVQRKSKMGKRGKRGPTKTKKWPTIHKMKEIKPRNLKKSLGPTRTLICQERLLNFSGKNLNMYFAVSLKTDQS